MIDPERSTAGPQSISKSGEFSQRIRAALSIESAICATGLTLIGAFRGLLPTCAQRMPLSRYWYGNGRPTCMNIRTRPAPTMPASAADRVEPGHGRVLIVPRSGGSRKLCQAMTEPDGTRSRRVSSAFAYPHADPPYARLHSTRRSAAGLYRTGNRREAASVARHWFCSCD